MPQPYGATPAPKRSGLAVAALVLGLLSLLLFVTFIVPLLALIFGLISASSIKKSAGQLTGIKQARTGWILGILGLVGFAVVIAVAANNDDVRVGSLEVGSCYNLPVSEAKAEVSSLKQVPCSELHDGELFNQYKMNPAEDRDYPSDADLFAEAGQACLADPWTKYFGSEYSPSSDLSTYVLVPSKSLWNSGGGQASCFVVEIDSSKIVGSLKGSGG
ncbi:MAG: septum formation family protein [Ilumatobacteraceae bacterium]